MYVNNTEIDADFTRCIQIEGIQGWWWSIVNLNFVRR